MAHFCLGLFLFFIRERREDGYDFKQRRESSSFKHIRFPSLPFSLDTCPCPFLQAVMAWFVVTTFEERTFNKWRQNVRQKRIKMKLWAYCGETFFPSDSFTSWQTWKKLCPETSSTSSFRETLLAGTESGHGTVPTKQVVEGAHDPSGQTSSSKRKAKSD